MKILLFCRSEDLFRFVRKGEMNLSLHIVLVEPEIPQNTGNIIRTCACIGAGLHLIRPLGFSLSEKQLKRAGLDYADLVGICVYDSFDDFCSRVPGGNLYFFTTKAGKNHTQVRYEEEVYLVFGPESRGLTEKIRSRIPENNLRIPMKDMERVRSLNLSNAVAVAAYEWIRQHPQELFK